MEKFINNSTRWIGSYQSLAVHTGMFVLFFLSWFFGVKLDTILLILTTVVSLEAIYLSIFIQMTVNRNTQSLEEVEKDVDEIQKDVDEIQEDVDEIQKDVDEIQEDVDEIQEDIVEIQEEDEPDITMAQIQVKLQELLNEIEKIKK